MASAVRAGKGDAMTANENGARRPRFRMFAELT
jgi:hypothetical protein